MNAVKLGLALILIGAALVLIGAILSAQDASFGGLIRKGNSNGGKIRKAHK